MPSPEIIDAVQLNFSEDGLLFMQIALGFIMFGIALELTLADFKRVLQSPKIALIGFTSQFLLLPALTALLIIIIKPMPSMALGLMLIACCPGGNISNYISHLSKGNTALSVSMTAIATLMAIILTPLNFALWSSLYKPAIPLLQEISLSPFDMAKTILLIIGIPLVVGLFIATKYPKVKAKIVKPIKVFSFLIFLAFVVGAIASNWDFILDYVYLVFILVGAHNLLALLTGYSFAKLFKLKEADSRTISVETGIQNGGLALILIFGFFDGLGGMAIVAAWWGIWDMLTGFGLGLVWSKFPPKDTATAT